MFNNFLSINNNTMKKTIILLLMTLSIPIQSQTIYMKYFTASRKYEKSIKRNSAILEIKLADSNNTPNI